MLQNGKNTTGKALAAGLLAAWMSVSPAANASGPNEEPVNDVSYTEGSQPAVKEMTSGDLVALALNYSIENEAVAIFVNKAPDTELSGEQIGTMIVRKFQEAGIPAAFVYNNAQAGQTRVDYFLDGVSYSGYALTAAFEGFELVSETYKALQTQDMAPSVAVR